MRLLRFLIFGLALGVGAQGWLDGCLTNCHAASLAAQTGSAHCHDAAGDADGLRVAGVPECAHDHDGLWADGGESRVGSARDASVALVPALVVPLHDGHHARVVDVGDTPRLRWRSAFATPLRL